LTDSSTTVGLDGAVDDLEKHIWNQHLSLCNLLEREFGVLAIDHNGRVEDLQTAGIDFNSAVSYTLELDAVLGELLAEWLLARVVDAGEEVLESLLRGTDGTHSVVDTARSETALDDFEAAALSKTHIGGWDADVVEENVTMSVWCIVEAHDGKHTVDGDTGNIVGDENDGLLLVLVAVVGVCLAQNNEDLAAWVTDT
jgi:hypothetical protein